MNSAIIALLLAGSAFAFKFPDDPMLARVARGQARNAFNLKRVGESTDDEKPKAAEKPTKLKEQVQHKYADHEIEVWYINQRKRTDRKQCMEKQLTNMGIVPHRFEALEPTKEDLKNGGKYHDCVKGGYAKETVYVDATAGGVSSGTKTKMGIIGDTCTHKRLFEQLSKSNSTAKYFVVLEDDAILNPLKFKTSINEFVDEKYGYKGPHAKDFQMVQLDFIGSFCMNHTVGHFGGKRVFKPQNIFQPGVTGKDGGHDCSRYFGSQALLMQKDTLASVVENMETHKTLPMDSVQGQLPRGLAWRPQIAKSPVQQVNELPDFCTQGTRQSSISFKQKLAPKRASKREIDINKWMDAFRTQTHKNDASDNASEE